MIVLALSLLLALEAAAAQAPAAPVTAPPAPAWPAGVVARERAELPWVVAALSVPIDQPPALLPLLAAWLEQPESWPTGPVARLLAAGGSVRATAHPDGLVVVAEGPAERQGEVTAAALALLQQAPPDESGFEPARAEALASSDARADSSNHDPARRRALWREWYGAAAASQRAGVSEEALLAATLPSLTAALDDVKRRSFGHQLFLEGPVTPSALPAATGALRPTWAPARPPSLPRPPPSPGVAPEGAARGSVPDVSTLESGASAPPSAASAPAADVAVVVVGHPLPPGPWSSVVGRAFTRALERRLSPLGETSAVVESSRHARLLVVTLRPKHGGGSPAEVREQARAAIAAALVSARQEAPGDRLLEDDLAFATAELARAERRLGAWAAQQAKQHLTGPAPEPVAPHKDVLTGLLRISVLPEVLRAAPPLGTLHPKVTLPRAPPPAASRQAPAGAAAPSAASAKGPG